MGFTSSTHRWNKCNLHLWVHGIAMRCTNIPTMYKPSNRSQMDSWRCTVSCFSFLFSQALLQHSLPRIPPTYNFSGTHEPAKQTPAPCSLYPYSNISLSSLWLLYYENFISCDWAMKFEDLLMEGSEEQQRILDLQEEVKTCDHFLSGYLNWYMFPIQNQREGYNTGI